MQPHAPRAHEREFVFTHADFERIRRLIGEHAGIALSASKQEMVYSRLARRLRARGLSRFSEYVSLLDGDSHEWQAFVNALTTNLTSFFREPHHFTALAKHAGEARRRSRGELTIWCCASATGEEPYSIAMTLADAFHSMTPPVRVLATDVDTNVLATAQVGVYSRERLAKLDPRMVRRFFVKNASNEPDTLSVRPELRRLVTFRPLNLLREEWPVRGPFDAIFCRNVMIYFDRPTQRQVLERLVPLLQPDGLLIAGHSESFLHSPDLVRLRGNTVYEAVSPAQSKR